MSRITFDNSRPPFTSLFNDHTKKLASDLYSNWQYQRETTMASILAWGGGIAVAAFLVRPLHPFTTHRTYINLDPSIPRN